MASKVVIVQAGGKGTRLLHNTWNKPKCLVPVNGKPLLYHLFDQYADAEFVVIGDYHFDTLKQYLAVNPPQVPYSLVRAQGTGTCAGIREAAALAPAGRELWLIWSDLVLDEPVACPVSAQPLVVLTDRFPCRWSASPDGQLNEVPSNTAGIIGMFAFADKAQLAEVPESGEFVRWLAGRFAAFDFLFLQGVKEVGEIGQLDDLRGRESHARFFNEVRMEGERVVKSARTAAFANLIEMEAAWYDKVTALGYANCPPLLAKEPLTIGRINGRHPYAIIRGREQVLDKILLAFERLHALSEAPVVAEDCLATYYDKTVARVDSVRAIIPYFESSEFLINGFRCTNWLRNDRRAELRAACEALVPDRFTLIHGDPTFSNILVGDDQAYLIDPRGYFGNTKLYGDPLYDYAKLYYSVAGNYDSFNNKRFVLRQRGNVVDLMLGVTGWEAYGARVLEAAGPGQGQRVKMLHALIWLALSGYCLDDVDSMRGAFFFGLLLLSDAMP